jgi:hypothetical protein
MAGREFGVAVKAAHAGASYMGGRKICPYGVAAASRPNGHTHGNFNCRSVFRIDHRSPVPGPDIWMALQRASGLRKALPLG